MGVGFEEPHFQLMVQFVEAKFPRAIHISGYAAYDGGPVLRYGSERLAVERQLTVLLYRWALFEAVRK